MRQHAIQETRLRDLDWTRETPELVPSEDGQADFTLRQMCEEFRVTPRALRFYESRELLRPQRAGTVRTYSAADRSRLALILKGKKLGFTLNEIAKLMASGGAPDGAFQLSREQCIEQINLLERQKREIETALSELRRAYSSHYTQALADGGRQPG